MEQTLSVNKENVYNEVAKTTSYTGAKMDDEAAYDRIFTTEEDKTMLERFWDESKNTICNSMKKFLVNEKESNDTYTLTLNLSASFDESLLESMERSLFSFFVMNITANGTRLPTNMRRRTMRLERLRTWRTSCARHSSRRSRNAQHTIKLRVKNKS